MKHKQYIPYIQPEKITLDKEINLGWAKLGEEHKVIKIKEILCHLHNEFPKGFFSKDATKELVSHFKNSPYNGTKSPCEFYSDLAKAGYLKIIKEYNRWTNKYVYKVVSEKLNNEGINLKNIKLDEGLSKLISTYCHLLKEESKEFVKGALEKKVTEDKLFNNLMKSFKAESPIKYNSMGGLYFDKLLEEKRERE
jgi:hypothetical protein